MTAATQAPASPGGSPDGQSMVGMGKEEAMMPRARRAAWTVFISMAGTTMSFQVYHSVKHGHMPWPLAGLYGVVPLFLSMLVIEFVSGWADAPWWARPSAYLIIIGAMYLSAAATGAVVLRAAPGHASLLFGLLLDGAAVLAARFLMTVGRVASVAASVPAPAALVASGEAVPVAVPGGVPQAAAVASSASVEATIEEKMEAATDDATEALEAATLAATEAIAADTIEETSPAVIPRAGARRGTQADDPDAKAARRAYRKSVADGNPLSDRALAARFDRGRTWGANRIAEVKEGPALSAQAR